MLEKGSCLLDTPFLRRAALWKAMTCGPSRRPATTPLLPHGQGTRIGNIRYWCALRLRIEYVDCKAVSLALAHCTRH